MPRRIAILDTTLRDGEQASGFGMNLDEKLEVARQLARLGVDVIEAGYPAAGSGEYASVKEIARVVRGPTIASMARATAHEIDAAWEAVRGAERPRLHVVLATSAQYMAERLKLGADGVLELAASSVRRARSLCPEVQFSAEDATRSDPDFLCRVLQAAIASGASIVNVPDTAGYAVPEEYAALIRRILSGVPDIDRATLSAHCHDDLGLAAANSLAAIGAGAGQVECTINGLGERAGNAALEEVVMALVTRAEVYRAYCGIETTQIYGTSKLVQAVTGIRPAPNKAIVGDNAFAHAAGCGIMRPESVGLPTGRLALGKHTGRSAFEERIAFLGFHPRPDAVSALFDGFRELAEKKKTVTDRDLEALVLGVSARGSEAFSLDRFVINSGSAIAATSAVRLCRHDTGLSERSSLSERNSLGERPSSVERASLIERVAVGDGPIDASFRAIDKIVGKQVVLEDFSLDAVTGGKDAQGEARVRIQFGGRHYNGRGLSTDVVEASIRAYIAAINAMAQDMEVTREPNNGS